jgi:thymidylate synthase
MGEIIINFKQKHMQQYLDHLRLILNVGTDKPAARSGMPGSKSFFGHQFRHDLSWGLPVLTTKKLYWKGIVAELLWMLRGETNIKPLIEAGCNWWNEDAYNYYVKIASANTGSEANAIYRPNMVVSGGVTTVESYSMFTLEEFVKAVSQQDGVLDLPHYNGYTLGDCGWQYGRLWRKWDDYNSEPDGTQTYKKIDQIAELIKGLRQQPESRRHMLTALNPAHYNDLALFPCHVLAQFNCRPLTPHQRVNLYYIKYASELPIDISTCDEANIPYYYLDCKLYQRSGDTVLGVPNNTASYSLLTHILAKMCNMVPGTFIHTFGDSHIYDNHKEAVAENLKRTPTELPTLSFSTEFEDLLVKWDIGDVFSTSEFLSILTPDMFILNDYNPQPAIKAELSTGRK